MKKTLLVVGLIGIVALAFGVVGFAYAQNQDPPTPDYPYGPGMMGNYTGGYGHGMMGGFGRGYGRGMMGWDGEYGPMHESMVTALAEALDIPSDEIESRHEAGETLWEIAEAEGISAQEFQELMLSAHDIALEDAVANGWITEEQAEWMDAHMEQMWNGGGHCFDQDGTDDNLYRRGMNW